MPKLLPKRRPWKVTPSPRLKPRRKKKRRFLRRAHIRGSAEAQSPAARAARPLRGEEEIKTKIDLSHISRPGDVLRAITQKKEAAAPPPARPIAPPVAAKPAVAPPAPVRPATPP